MGIFSGIGDAKVGIGGVYFDTGNYVVKIRAAKMVLSRKKDDLYTVECDVKESDNQAIRPGTMATWQTNAAYDSFLGNVKAFLAATNGADPSNEAELAATFPNKGDAEAAAEYSVSADNPLAGTWLNLNCVKKKTKSGGDFTVHNWSVYPKAGQSLHPEYVAEQGRK